MKSEFIKTLVIGSFILAPGFLYSLELWNLELMLEIPCPDTIKPYSFGFGLASGDVNGDGFSDIVIGGGYNGETELIYVFYGSSCIDAIPDVILDGENDKLTDRMAIGDVNGDGFDDVICEGIDSYTEKQECRVHFGGNPMDSICDLKIRDDFNAIASGDLNGDGYDDIIIGASYSYNYHGKVTIYFGGPDMDDIPDVVLYGEFANAGLGSMLSSGFDVNGDGYEDLFISALRLFIPSETYIYYGGDPMDTLPDVKMVGPEGNLWFGAEIPLVPDLNGDGYDDACIGNIRDTVYTYWGGNPMDNIPDVIFSDTGAYYGCAITGVENIHPQGKRALVVGARDYYPQGSDVQGYSYLGKVSIYLGGPSLDTKCEGWVVGADSQEIGWEVASAGDVNGDGVSEIMFSNYAADYKLKEVWVCKYTGHGIEESAKCKVQNAKLEIYPNPVIQSAIIKYQIPEESNVSLKIYDISGRDVRTLVDKRLKAGNYTSVWSGNDKKDKKIASGVYFCKLKIESKELRVEKEKKMLFLGQREER